MIYMICMNSVLLPGKADAEGIRRAAWKRSALDEPGDGCLLIGD